MTAHSLPTESSALRSTLGQDRIIERPNFWRRHRKLGTASIAALIVLIMMTLYWHRFLGASTSVDRSRLIISTVERGGFTRDVAADGQVVASGSPTLYANSPGSVSLAVHAGDTVAKGQVLAMLDSPDLAAKLRQEEASLEGLRIDWQRAQLDARHKLAQVQDALLQAEVDQKTAQRELDRSTKAFELGAYSELQVLRATDALEKAKFAEAQASLNFKSQPEQNVFDVNSKRAMVDRQRFLVTDLRRQVDGLTIKSPVDGQIGQVQIADRATVTKDAPLLTVVDLSLLEVEIKVAESLVRELHRGMTAELTGDGHTWTGTVSGVSPEVVNGQVTTRVRFGADKPAGLRQSERLSVRILIDHREGVLMVDRGAFVDQDGGNFAYVVHGGVAERRAIRLGASSIAKVEVLEGLADGDQVVTSGTDAFKGSKQVILSH